MNTAYLTIWKDTILYNIKILLRFFNSDVVSYINWFYISILTPYCPKNRIYGDRRDLSSIILQDGIVYRSTSINILSENEISKHTFKRINYPFNIRSISSGNEHEMILTRDGLLYSIGGNAFGQLGLGDTHSCQDYMKIIVPDNNTIRSMSCGPFSSHFINNRSELYSWGDNEKGNLGIKENPSIIISVPSKALSNVIYVLSTINSTFVIRDNGDLYSAGEWLISPLADYTYVTYYKKIDTPKPVLHIVGYSNFIIILTTDGLLYMGYNKFTGVKTTTFNSVHTTKSLIYLNLPDNKKTPFIRIEYDINRFLYLTEEEYHAYGYLKYDKLRISL